MSIYGKYITEEFIKYPLRDFYERRIRRDLLYGNTEKAKFHLDLYKKEFGIDKKRELYELVYGEKPQIKNDNNKSSSTNNTEETKSDNLEITPEEK